MYIRKQSNVKANAEQRELKGTVTNAQHVRRNAARKLKT
jgi:hypothetical protein